MKNNTLSVVIPCYNANKRIINCINSIKLSLKNLHPEFEFEIIVVDDGSTDETSNKIKKINDIRIITHSKNKGLSSARNSGINASQSKFIAYREMRGYYLHAIDALANLQIKSDSNNTFNIYKNEKLRGNIPF